MGIYFVIPSIPPMLDGAYKDKKWQGNLENEGYSLFYNPPSLYTKGMRFRTSKQKVTSQAYAAERLKEVMIKAQNNQKPVQWGAWGWH